MKISFITTVLNEEETVEKLLDSLCNQSKLPDEIIIVDGGSIDSTLSIVFNFLASRRSGQFPISNNMIKILTKKGNRAVGRNEAIKQATGDIILCSDAGCILDKNLIKNITGPFKNQHADVVAGYYKGVGKTVFEKCLIPYVLVMPDKVDDKEFLPATRSIAFRKIVWKQIGGFDEEFSHNEDYVFAKKLKKIGARIIFRKDAIVSWIPRSSFQEAFSMFFRFAYGDAESLIFRPKVILLFMRYFMGTLFLILFLLFKWHMLLYILFIGFFFYLVLSVVKNYKYVKRWEATFLLPTIQLIADTAILIGTTAGFVKSRLR